MFKKIGIGVLLLALASVMAFADEPDQLPANFLGGAKPLHANPHGGFHGNGGGNIPTPHGFPLGIDTISNFTGHFESQGIFWDGSPHHVWEYSMVGADPAQGGTTTYNAPV